MRPLGTFTVPASHPSLPGHFPGRPIVPGVVLLDEAAALILAQTPGSTLAGFPTIRFAHPVRPGETVHVGLDGDAFACTVDGATVLRGTIALGK